MYTKAVKSCAFKTLRLFPFCIFSIPLLVLFLLPFEAPLYSSGESQITCRIRISSEYLPFLGLHDLNRTLERKGERFAVWGRKFRERIASCCPSNTRYFMDESSKEFETEMKIQTEGQVSHVVSLLLLGLFFQVFSLEFHHWWHSVSHFIPSCFPFKTHRDAICSLLDFRSESICQSPLRVKCYLNKKKKVREIKVIEKKSSPWKVP